MIPPTSIDGTDITGATIDGQDVQEITVDGQTVFSAQNLPVAYSNLIAWYPFDSAEYGGANADDVTAIIGGSGDDTAFDGSLNGATYQSNGGVTDINAGANSGAFSFDGSDRIDVSMSLSLMDPEHTVMCYVNVDSGRGEYVTSRGSGVGWFSLGEITNGKHNWYHFDGSDAYLIQSNTAVDGQWFHVAGTYKSNGDMELFVDGVLEGTDNSDGFGSADNEFSIGARTDGSLALDGTIDDVRIYDTALTSSQINSIIANTPHP